MIEKIKETKSGEKNVDNGKKSDNKSELIIDLLGSIIDISKIPDFKDIPDVRYRRIEELVNVLESVKKERWRENKLVKTTGKKIETDVEKTVTTEVEKIIETYLDQTFHVSIIDPEVLECLVKAKPCADINIISSIENKGLHGKAVKAVIKYSDELCKQLERKKIEENPGGDSKSPGGLKDFQMLSKGDFAQFNQSKKPIEDLNGQKEDGKYRIVFSEEDDKLDVKKKAVRKWLRGGVEKECVKILGEKVKKMRQIAKAENDLKKLVKKRASETDTKIEMKNYMVDEKFGYYVFDKYDKDRLKKRIEEIDSILKNEEDLKKGNKPICVFLAGVPGTGKSYFVELLAKKLRSDGKYRFTSLSGVPKKDFADAVVNHIKAVYDTCDNASGNIVAFLDEVDTKGGVDEYAFRLLMDAMTGNRPDGEGGVTKTEAAKNLVWVFAGSAKTKREEFIEEFYKDERKVADFFDRIHFYIQLPSVESSGQAILTFLSVLDRPEDKTIIKVKRGVLYLFGRTLWKSARQIKTVCRIATNRKEFDWGKKEVIDLDSFRKINVWKDFVTTLEVIDSLQGNTDLNLNEDIIIEFPAKKKPDGKNHQKEGGNKPRLGKKK